MPVEIHVIEKMASSSMTLEVEGEIINDLDVCAHLVAIHRALSHSVVPRPRSVWTKQWLHRRLTVSSVFEEIEKAHAIHVKCNIFCQEAKCMPNEMYVA